jgi:hypothetical protein
MELAGTMLISYFVFPVAILMLIIAFAEGKKPKMSQKKVKVFLITSLILLAIGGGILVTGIRDYRECDDLKAEGSGVNRIMNRTILKGDLVKGDVIEVTFRSEDQVNVYFERSREEYDCIELVNLVEGSTGGTIEHKVEKGGSFSLAFGRSEGENGTLNYLVRYNRESSRDQAMTESILGAGIVIPAAVVIFWMIRHRRDDHAGGRDLPPQDPQ